jgi:Ca2+-binding RTX toxin-like protein
VSGNSTALQSLESSFHQDLNGDGQVGLVTTVIEANGATTLAQAGDQYFLNDGMGSGPTLKIFGTDHLAGMAGIAGAWTPIAAEKTATGYEVAWKGAGADQYTVWNTDNNGNYISNIGVVSGGDAALKALESSFHQDLNGDGQISPAATVLDGHLGGQTLTAAGGPTVLMGGPSDTLTGGAGADTFVFPASFGSNTVKNFTPGSDALQFSQAMFADVAAVLSDAHQVGSNVVITHDPQNVVTLQNLQINNLHASDIHIV